MDHIKQRIAIAEACGWTEIQLRPDDKTQAIYLAGLVPDAEMLDSQGADTMYFVIPDYLNSLDAMHEAEKVIAMMPEKRITYAHCLMNATSKSWAAFHATAAQRAEAFLRTLNRWID